MFLPILFSFLLSCTKEQAVAAKNDPVPNTVNKTVLLQLVNEARKKGCNCGDSYYPPVPALTWNDVLEKAAYNHSKDMNDKNFFSHTGTDGSGSGERISREGYNWNYYGENLAFGYMSEKQVVDGWLSSPGHCRNIMNKSFKEMGVARVNNYWTQDLGSR